MRLRNGILLILCLALSIPTLAETLSGQQLKIRNEVKTFLSEEGFVPEITSSGDIRYNSEGNVYVFSINPEIENPFYADLSLSFSLPDNYSAKELKIAAAELNFYKGVKALCYDDHISIQSEMFITTADEFKYAFYLIMHQLKSAAGDFLEECAKVVGAEGRTSTSSSRQSSNGTGQSQRAAQQSSAPTTSSSTAGFVVSYPEVSGQLDRKAKIRKVTITEKYTCIEISSNNVQDGQSYEWCNIDKDTYFVIEGNGFEKYKLTRAEGIKIAPEKTYFGGYNKTIVFKLYFPPIPKTTKSISLTEPDSSWCFFGIQLNK